MGFSDLNTTVEYTKSTQAVNGAERIGPVFQELLAAYAAAIRQHYRFYSYGDCMLIL